MARLIKCKVCGAEIAKNAKACPCCGARLRRGSRVLGIILAIIGFCMIFSALMDTGGTRPQKIGTVSSEKRQERTAPTEAASSEFGIGETVALNDISVTLVSVEESIGGNYMIPDDGQVFLVCEFEIKNGSSRDIAISSLLSFETYVDDYLTTLDLEATLCTGKKQLDGTIAPGKKMSGVVGYAADQQWSNLEIRFTPDFWTGHDIIFQYEK